MHKIIVAGTTSFNTNPVRVHRAWERGYRFVIASTRHKLASEGDVFWRSRTGLVLRVFTVPEGHDNGHPHAEGIFLMLKELHSFLKEQGVEVPPWDEEWTGAQLEGGNSPVDRTSWMQVQDRLLTSLKTLFDDEFHPIALGDVVVVTEGSSVGKEAMVISKSDDRAPDGSRWVKTDSGVFPEAQLVWKRSPEWR